MEGTVPRHRGEVCGSPLPGQNQRCHRDHIRYGGGRASGADLETNYLPEVAGHSRSPALHGYLRCFYLYLEGLR